MTKIGWQLSELLLANFRADKNFNVMFLCEDKKILLRNSDIWGNLLNLTLQLSKFLKKSCVKMSFMHITSFLPLTIEAKTAVVPLSKTYWPMHAQKNLLWSTSIWNFNFMQNQFIPPFNPPCLWPFMIWYNNVTHLCYMTLITT